MRNTTFAIITAIGASLCCTGPILFASLGATSLSGLTFLEPIRPYLSIGAIGLLGLAFWRSYRPPKAEACCSIEEQVRLKRQRRTLWVAMPVVILLLAFPYFPRASVAVIDMSIPAANDQSVMSKWMINGMTCPGCAAGLEATLAAEAGMLTCKVHFEEKSMLCQFDSERLKSTDISVLVEKLGFKVRSVEKLVSSTKSGGA